MIKYVCHKSTKQFGFSFALIPPLYGIHSLKTSVHHPLWPLLERSSKPISTQRLILLSSLFLWLLRGADLFFVPGLYICLLLLSCCTLESTTQWRLSAIKVELELPLDYSAIVTFDFISLQLRITIGIYYVYIKDWMSVWPEDQLLVLKLEEYSLHKLYSINRVIDFIGLGKLHSIECQACIL